MNALLAKRRDNPPLVVVANTLQDSTEQDKTLMIHG